MTVIVDKCNIKDQISVIMETDVTIFGNLIYAYYSNMISPTIKHLYMLAYLFKCNS